MPRILSRAGILVALFAPALALAAYNDVTLTTDTVISVNGITVNVHASSSVIESMTVDTADFSVTLASGSTFEVNAPNFNRLAYSTNTGLTSDICNSGLSLLRYAPTSSVTVTITPSTTLCAASGGSSSSSSSSSSASPATQATPATPASTTTPATPAIPATPATPATKSSSGLSATQIQSILDVLVSFNADASVIAKVKASLEGTAVKGSVTSTAVKIFKTNLTVGSLGSEVKALQEYLNAHGYTVATSGAGSPGNETTKFGNLTRAALIKYQKAKGITPAVGYFGPVSRAAINSDS